MNTNTLTTRLQQALEPRALRYLYALAWATFTAVILLQSSSHPVIGPPAPPEPANLGREIVLTSLHVITFAVFSALWWWAFVATMPSKNAVILSALVSLAVGTATELLQVYVPDRSATITDLLANYGAVVVTLWWLHRHQAEILRAFRSIKP